MTDREGPRSRREADHVLMLAARHDDPGIERMARNVAARRALRARETPGLADRVAAAARKVAARRDDPAPDAEPSVLAEADGITSEGRRRYYGHPLDNHACTADLWTAYLERTGAIEAGVRLDVRDVAMLNILQKISRDANRRKRDNLVDLCGYARNVEQAIAEARARGLDDVAEALSGEPDPAAG